jgi:predicted KAP-like P-loop ATPase
VSGREVADLINLTSQPDAFAQRILKAKSEKRPDGSSKSRVLLDRLMDHVQKDIPESAIPGIINVLLNIGDLLLEPEATRGMLEPSSEVYVCRPVYQLLKRLKAEDRFNVLERAIEGANALSVSLSLLYWLEKGIEKPESVLDGALITSEELTTLKADWLNRVHDLQDEDSFLRNPDLSQVLSAWRHWGDVTEVRQVCERRTRSDENLLVFLNAFFRHTRSVQAGDRSMRLQARLNPKWVEPYLDTNRCHERLTALQNTKAVPVAYQEIVAQYILESHLISDGKDPEGFGAFEDR